MGPQPLASPGRLVDEHPDVVVDGSRVPSGWRRARGRWSRRRARSGVGRRGAGRRAGSCPRRPPRAGRHRGGWSRPATRRGSSQIRRLGSWYSRWRSRSSEANGTSDRAWSRMTTRAGAAARTARTIASETRVSRAPRRRAATASSPRARTSATSWKAASARSPSAATPVSSSSPTTGTLAQPAESAAAKGTWSGSPAPSRMRRPMATGHRASAPICACQATNADRPTRATAVASGGLDGAVVGAWLSASPFGIGGYSTSRIGSPSSLPSTLSCPAAGRRTQAVLAHPAVRGVVGVAGVPEWDGDTDDLLLPLYDELELG